MVHALREIHDLLTPNGALLDIRPNGELVDFVRLVGDDEHFIGHLQESDDYIEYVQAEAAMRDVVSAGLFEIKKAEEFPFFVYADFFDELKTFLEENWGDAVITDDVIAEAKRLDDAYGVGKVFLREKVRIYLLV